ncbi:MAG: flagellar basal body P-ring protein FlgI [Gammaproteobacteria bacterium]|nr:flagellar basal body P-ring protein FlgI [Gammaproteobacteria bacterium]
MKQKLFIIIIFSLTISDIFASATVKLSQIGRFEGIRDNQIVGYGLVVGLAGTGDSSRNKTTIQSIANTVRNFGITLDTNDIRSRNVAAVLVTGTLPAFSEKGDKLDIKVSSIGDARSIAGGTLILTPLKAANNEIYALAQGPISVGGYAFDSFDSVVQKNHPTVGLISGGALVERSTKETFAQTNQIRFLLNESSFETVVKIVDKINGVSSKLRAEPLHAGKINIHFSELSNSERFKLISQINSLTLEHNIEARVVINERTGTIVSGGDVRLSNVTVSHGDIQLTIDTRYQVSQPFFIGRPGSSVSTEVVPETKINVTEEKAGYAEVQNNATVANLVESLKVLDVSTRDIIVILQSIKRAGALHAELVVE